MRRLDCEDDQGGATTAEKEVETEVEDRDGRGGTDSRDRGDRRSSGKVGWRHRRATSMLGGIG